MTPGKRAVFERAELYARMARQHRAAAAASPVGSLKRRRHQRDAVQLEAAVRSTANEIIHLARLEAEASDER